MAKKLKKEQESKISFKGLILAIILVILFFNFGFKNKVNKIQIPVVKEDVSQLTSTDKYVGNAVASRSFSGNKFHLSLTAFLTKPMRNQVYRVNLINESLDPKSISLGELLPAGDVYTLNYESDTDFRAYNVIEVIIFNSETKSEKILLKGSF